MGQIVFFGSNYAVLEKILRVIDVRLVVCENKQVNKEIMTLCFMRRISTTIVKDYEELSQIEVEASLGISCGFGIIFKMDFINKFKQGIMNIHFGDLPGIRGRHPISWAFIENMFEIGVTFHLVDERIDVGCHVHKYHVERCLNDSQVEIESKILEMLPQHVAIAIKHIRAGNLTEMEEGKYYPSLAGQLVEIRSQDYEAIFLLNCVRAQKSFGGVIINGKKVLSCFVYDSELNIDNHKYTIIESKDRVKLMASSAL